MGDWEIDSTGVSICATMDSTFEDGMDTVDGLSCIVHSTTHDTVHPVYRNPERDRLAENNLPKRSELRVKHAQQDTMGGDELGGTLVTYTTDDGDNFHHFEEFGLYNTSVLRDALHLRQNDQLVTIDGYTVNELDHESVLKLFLNLEIGREHVMKVANPQVSTDTLRQISFTLFGFIKEEAEDEGKPPSVLEVENLTTASIPFNAPEIDEVSITLADDEKNDYYLNKDLLFNRSVETDTSVHFIRKKTVKLVGSNFRINATFENKSSGFIAINESGDVVRLRRYDPSANFKATFNGWGSWYIRSHKYGRCLAEQNLRLITKPTDKHGEFVIKTVKCKQCI